MPRTEQQFNRIRKERKQAIMATALEEFATNGYENTSIRVIAKEAGVSKGLIYNYFESKEDLLAHIMMTGIEEMVPLIDPNHDGVITKEEFIFLIDESFRIMKEKIAFYRLYLSLVMQPSVTKLFADKMNKVAAPFIKMFVDYFEKKGSKKPMLEATMVGALLDGIGFNYAFNPEAYPLDDVVELVKEKLV